MDIDQEFCKHIKFKHKLRTVNLENQLIQQIYEKARTFQGIDELRNFPHFITLICNIIEYSVPKGQKIDKLETVVKTCSKIWNNNIEENDRIRIQIQCDYDNGLIKRMNTIKWILKSLKDIFLIKK